MIPRVALIIINYNGKNDTLECLQSLRGDCYENKTVIVVDNGSSDDSVTMIRQQFPEITLIETKDNLGFTGGNNAGIRFAMEQGYDYVYLLNNDTTSKPDALRQLVQAAMEDKGWGILTPVIHYYDRPAEAWFAGAKLDLTRGTAEHDNSRCPALAEKPHEIPWASGCAMLIPMNVIRTVNGFDDRYFLNWEDVDLSLRVCKAGYRVGLVPSARIYHKVGRSIQSGSAMACYYYVRNNFLLVHLHGGGGKMRLFGRRLKEAMRSIVRRDSHSMVYLRAVLAGTRDYLLGRFGRRGKCA